MAYRNPSLFGSNGVVFLFKIKTMSFDRTEVFILALSRYSACVIVFTDF